MEATEIASAATAEFVQSLLHFGIVGFDVFLLLDVSELEFSL